jgi:SpoVK/Ycf46/Vps4 family AAA+-type ATPase
VLFAGESGTGKTMGAQVLGAELGLELFRVDLATVVSKYIGETEKNLERIFSAADGSNAILFFDEADALFGKRSEVSDSHDRYANIEVAYLLQRMEQYPGAVILATNYKRNIDDAFIRRLDFVVDFPFPEAEDRRRIWSLVIPDAAPLADDVDLDFLATQFKLSGGAIRNCSLAAAFQAADGDTEIQMRHLVRAVAQEYAKQGRLTLEADFARFHEFVRLPDTTGS